MPASRSRTERWRECLLQILDRAGPIDITLPTPAPSPLNPMRLAPARSLVWRVRLLAVAEHDLLIEQPSAMGTPIDLAPGAELVGAMAIGQNRWMFHTRVLGVGPGSRAGRCLRLALPERVERCQRRSFYRISSATLDLPPVELWPLLDPVSAVAAEVANRAAVNDAREGRVPADGAMVLPEVGPMCRAELANVGGGGVGLIVTGDDARALDASRTFWMRIDLTPQVPVPLGLTAKLVHTRLDSQQNVYVGFAFDFTFNPSHEAFVVREICRFVSRAQREQFERSKRIAS